MTKIRTIEELQARLDEELVWRKKELAVIKALVTASPSSPEKTNCHIRSGIALLYAHWEGFIKAAGNAYLTYVASQRLPYYELSNNFIVVGAKSRLDKATNSDKVTAYTDLADFFMSGLTERCGLFEVKTNSNLSSKELKEITYMLGLDYGAYVTKEKLINESLLTRRNTIAHGNFLTMDDKGYIELHETIIELLNTFSNQISNAASTQAYKRVP